MSTRNAWVLVPPHIGKPWIERVKERMKLTIAVYTPDRCVKLEGDEVIKLKLKSIMLIITFKILRDAVTKKREEFRREFRGKCFDLETNGIIIRLDRDLSTLIRHADIRFSEVQKNLDMNGFTTFSDAHVSDLRSMINTLGDTPISCSYEPELATLTVFSPCVLPTANPIPVSVIFGNVHGAYAIPGLEGM